MAADIYNISSSTARVYMHLYRHMNQLPEKKANCKTRGKRIQFIILSKPNTIVFSSLTSLIWRFIQSIFPLTE